MKESFQPIDANYKERVQNSFDKQDALRTIGATIRKIDSGQVEIGFDYNIALTQQHNFIHAGILSTVLDSACGYAAFTLMPENASVLTIEYKINLLSPAKGEYFNAVGKVKKPGRTITVADGEIYAQTGSSNKLIATMTGTLMTIIGRDGVTE